MTVAACLAVLGYRFARLPGWRDQRWFWLIAASASSYTGFNTIVTLDVPTWVARLGAHGSWASLSLHVIAWTLHSAAHFHTELSRLERWVVGTAAAVGVSALLPGLLLQDAIVTHQFLGVVYHEPVPTLLGSFAAAPLYAALLGPAVRFLRHARRSPDARRYAAGLLLLCVCGLNDLLASTGQYSLPYLLDAGYLLMVALVWSVLMERFTSATHRLDMLSTQLEGVVTERTRELAKAHEALAQAERLAAVGRLSAGVAHEINNPSAAVVSNLSYLKSSFARGELPADAGEALDDSLTSMGKIARIVRQLLDTGRVAAADSSMRSTFDVALAIDHAVQTARAALGRELDVVLDVPPTYGVGDQLMVEQVLVNLIVNGVQAAPDSRKPRVHIRAEQDTSAVKISVSDNGSGMTEGVARRAFEPFFSTKPFGQGTGLGLSVSLGLATAVGGDLRVASSTAEGTTMELTVRSSLRLSSAPPPREGPASRPAQRLLVIDDDPIVRESLSRMLGRTFDVETATGVGDARRTVSGAHFDAILCDVMMDEGGGEAFYTWLRRERPSSAGRVIFVTGGVTDEASRRFLDSQEQPVLYKPVDLTTVERAVGEVSLGVATSS
ncbi:MAG: Two-component sensor histidine kinase [Polyangiaceae bacterium]|jgi:signal transduction histidine kinase/ActR/RegA family two-component response regulator|nr:Two-component sensor histidine kinase [Polyangiaceae bacterium]